jgi:hypothetical protein
MDNDTAAQIKRLESSCARWRVASGLALVLAIVALIVPQLREPFKGTIASPASQPASGSPSFEQLAVTNLKVKWLEVIDDKGNVVISMNEGAGGGILSVASATPNDHNVMIMASPHGAAVQVSSQKKPRQFGFLKIMDRKPYLQMYEEGEAGHAENSYQVPLYSADGKLGGPAAQ